MISTKTYLNAYCSLETNVLRFQGDRFKGWGHINDGRRGTDWRFCK